MNYDPDAVAKAWLSSASSGFEDDESLWAFEMLGPLAGLQPADFLWQVLLELVNRAESKKILSLIGAGPLESLLVHHGPTVIERVKDKASRNDRFLYVLTSVWEGGMDEDVWDQVQRICTEALNGRSADHLV